MNSELTKEEKIDKIEEEIDAIKWALDSGKCSPSVYKIFEENLIIKLIELDELTGRSR